jgi:hypothetical protein
LPTVEGTAALAFSTNTVSIDCQAASRRMEMGFTITSW